jgi:hypothetical protein
LDATPENAIKHVLTEWFDPNLILITEEDSKKANLSGSDHEVVCFVAPFDGSKLVAEFLQNNISDPSLRLRDVIAAERYGKMWAQQHLWPPSITGCSCSITAVRAGNILCQ